MSGEAAPLRVALIGTGRHASTSLHPALRTAGIEPVAVCARHLDHAEAAARRLGAKRAHDDVHAMLRGGGFDAAIISVAPEDYAPLLRACIETGVPAFVEKPAAASSRQARELATLAEARGVAVMVGYMKRFAPAYRRAREISGAESFGGLRMASFKFVVGRMALSAAGYLVENACHPVDLARFLCGTVEEVEAMHRGDADRGHAIAVLARTVGGALITFEIGTIGGWFQHNERVELYGDGESVCVDNLDTLIHRPRSGPAQVTVPNYTVPLPPNFTATTMGFVPELEHFRAVVQQRVACESDLGSAASTLELLDRIAAAAGA